MNVIFNSIPVFKNVESTLNEDVETNINLIFKVIFVIYLD